MDIESTTRNPRLNVSQKIAQVETTSRKAAVGQNAKLVLDVLDPILEKQLGVLLDQFRQCPPELGPLLDFRAKITEIWSMRRAVSVSVQEGKTAEDTLRAMMETYAAKAKTNGAPNNTIVGGV